MIGSGGGSFGVERVPFDKFTLVVKDAQLDSGVANINGKEHVSTFERQAVIDEIPAILTARAKALREPLFGHRSIVIDLH